MGLCQVMDSIPTHCGWLGIDIPGYPLLPPDIHEAIHEPGGQHRDYPHSSTRSPQCSPQCGGCGPFLAQMRLHTVPTSYPRCWSVVHTIIHR